MCLLDNNQINNPILKVYLSDQDHLILSLTAFTTQQSQQLQQWIMSPHSVSPDPLLLTKTWITPTKSEVGICVKVVKWEKTHTGCSKVQGILSA